MPTTKENETSSVTEGTATTRRGTAVGTMTERNITWASTRPAVKKSVAKRNARRKTQKRGCGNAGLGHAANKRKNSIRFKNKNRSRNHLRNRDLRQIPIRHKPRFEEHPRCE